MKNQGIDMSKKEEFWCPDDGEKLRHKHFSEGHKFVNRGKEITISDIWYCPECSYFLYDEINEK